MDRVSKRYISSVITRQSEGGAGLESDSTTAPTPAVPRSQTETVIKGDIPTLPAAACETHNGLARAQNSNLSPLTSETMWYQLILIEHLTVLLLLQQHTHFSSSRRVSMWTLKMTTFRKVHSSNCPRNSHFSPKIVCLPGTEIWGTGPKIKKKNSFCSLFRKVEISHGISYVPG